MSMASQVATCFSSHCNPLLYQTKHSTPLSIDITIAPIVTTASCLLPSRPWRNPFSRPTHTTPSPHVYGDTQDRSLCPGRRPHPRGGKIQVRAEA